MELCCRRTDGTVDERLCYLPVHPGWSQPLRHWPATPPPPARNPLPCRRPATPSPAAGRPMRSWTGLAECNSSRSSQLSGPYRHHCLLPTRRRTRQLFEALVMEIQQHGAGSDSDLARDLDEVSILCCKFLLFSEFDSITQVADVFLRNRDQSECQTWSVSGSWLLDSVKIETINSLICMQHCSHLKISSELISGKKTHKTWN
jgi:hypothetical protein